MKHLFALIAFVFLANISAAQTSQEIYHRVKIFYDDIEQLKLIENAGIAIDHGFYKKETYFESDFSQAELETIKGLGFTTEISIDNVGAYYKNQNNPNHKDFVDFNQARNANCSGNSIDYLTPTNFNVFPANQYGGFYTYSQLLQELDDMASLYPNLITVKADIGPNGNPFLTEGTPDAGNPTTPSIGGNTIKWVKISDNPNTDESEPEVLYTAIHHAREPASLSQLVFYMWYLLENYDTDSEIKSIVDNTELYFVPVINPDGYLYNEQTDPEGGGFWRKNRHDDDNNAGNGVGIDNNRNYDYYINGDPNDGIWGGPGSSPNENSPTYHGTEPFSEEETKAMKWFVEQHDFVLALNNHTFGDIIYYPFGYADVATPDDNLYQGILAEMTSQNGYSPVRDSPFAGDSDDFMYGTVGTHNKIISMTPEIGNSFWPAQSSIEVICKEMMYFNITAAQLAGNYATIVDNSPEFVETISSNISYTIKRLGIEEPADFTVSVNPVSANIQSVGSSNIHNGLTFSQEVTDVITLNLDSNINTGDIITYELVVNNGMYDKVVSVSKIYGQPMEVFNEAGDNTSNWSSSTWASTTEDFAPGSASSSITDSPNSNYSDNQNTTITLSNTIDLTGVTYANLSFQAKWDIESNFDYVQIEVSIDNGSNWIPQCGNFTNTGVPNQGAANGQPVYDGTQNSWVTETISLSDYIGENILIRFQLVSDGGVTEDGFYFDDLKVQTLQPNLSNPEFEQNLFSVYPNPVNSILNILTTESDYSISIFNIQGQLIFSSKNNSELTSIDYSEYSKGVYLLNIESNSLNKTFKIIKR